MSTTIMLHAYHKSDPEATERFEATAYDLEYALSGEPTMVLKVDADGSQVTVFCTKRQLRQIRRAISKALVS